MASDPATDDTANFTGDCGENSSSYNTASNTNGMQLGQSATINGRSTGDCVVGNDDAAALSITVNYAPPGSEPYAYEIQVWGRGPKGIMGGTFYLAFRDQTGDVYNLKLYSSDLKLHTVDYNSDSPAITDIYWSDENFDPG